jgi:hypothetical protein
MAEIKIETLYEMAVDIDVLLRDSDHKLQVAREYLQLLKNNLEKFTKKSNKKSKAKVKRNKENLHDIWGEEK